MWASSFRKRAQAARPASLEQLSAACASALTDAQRELDRAALESLERWQEDGIPPSAFVWSGCTLRLSAGFGVEGRRRPRLTVRPHQGPQVVTLGFRHLRPDRGGSG
jgi:hypothetical protein